MSTARTTSFLSTLSLAAGVGLSLSPASAATLRTLSAPPQNAAVPSGPIITFKGHRLRVGWAAGRLREMQRHLPQPSIFVLPQHPLYVADPGLNGIAIFNKNGLNQQLPSAFLAGPNTQISGPVAITGGFDVPCTTGVAPSKTTCANYLWVANAGTDTITVYGTGVIGQPPLYVANQAPLYVISNPATGCSVGMGFQGGIIHGGPRTVPGYTSFNNGYIFETSESSNAIETYDAVLPPPPASITECPLSYETASGILISPSGPSANGSLLPILHARLFNANGNTVTRSHFYDPTFTAPTAADVWSVGANTQGTALDMGMPGGALWVTTAQAGNGAVYLCTANAFPSGCPTTPVITGLSYPVFPKAAQGRLFVPDQNLGTVTEYRENSPYTLRATFVNLASPWDVAGVGD